MPLTKSISPEPIKITTELQASKNILADVQDNFQTADTDTKEPLTPKQKFYVAMELFWEKFLKDVPNIEQDLDKKITNFLNNRLI